MDYPKKEYEKDNKINKIAKIISTENLNHTEKLMRKEKRKRGDESI